MSLSFVRPSFKGARFDNHTLPVDVASDLAAYEKLLIDLAKHLFLLDNPERQRVPNGFSDVHLAIENINKGSANPVLTLSHNANYTNNQLSFLEIGFSDYYNQARDLISECIDSADSVLPEKFPKELLLHFNQLGRSLKEGESFELPLKRTGQIAVLNPKKRKSLVLAANLLYEREVELRGYIGEADWEKSSFRLRLSDGYQTNVPMQESFHNMIRQSGGRTRDCVIVKGIALHDSWDRLQKVIYINNIEVIKNYNLTIRFDEISQYQNGWFDGLGVAPDANILKTVAYEITESYPDYLLLPNIILTQEGNLLLEWNINGEPSVDIILNDHIACYHSFGSNGEDIEKDFSLNTKEDYLLMYSFLSTYIHAELE